MFHNAMCVNSGSGQKSVIEFDYLCVLYLLVHIARSQHSTRMTTADEKKFHTHRGIVNIDKVFVVSSRRELVVNVLFVECAPRELKTN
jgi:hypothetical protein